MEDRTPAKTSRKIIFYGAASADGYIARADGGADWLNEGPRPKGSYRMGEFYRSIDTILWDRKTVDLALQFQKEGVKHSAFDPRVRNYVFSRQPRAPVAGVEFVREPIPEFAERLRAAPGKDVWMMGGAGILASFLDAGEMDEFIINVVPVFIGEGIPLMAPRHRKVPLKLLETKTFPDGIVRLRYSVSGSGRATVRA